MSVQLLLLGVPRFLIDGHAVLLSWPRRSLALLTLLVTARSVVHRDTIALALWPDEDEEIARANVRRNLNGLRALLPAAAAGWISTDAGAIEFRHAEADTDVAAFESAAAASDGLRRAAALYSGDFATPLDEPWVVRERERLRARFHDVLTELVGIEFSARRFDAALSAARRILADEPFREDIARRVLAIRYAMGDRPGALLEFERYARSLRTEMSIDPMPETYGLRDLILRGDPLPFAPDVAFPQMAPVIGRAPPLLPFAGRRAPLEAMDSAWRSASVGNGKVLFVRGQAGIGKTRLVAEFLERVVGPSARIFRGTTASPETRPYEALLRALGQTAPFVSTLDLEPVWLGALAPLVPEIGARVRAHWAQAPLSPERERTRLFEAFARIAAALARGRPVVIVLEDLHWSGVGTLDALRYIAARLAGHRVFVVGTYRTGEGCAAETLARDLSAAGQAATVALAPLALGETLDMLGRIVPPIPPQAALELSQRSEGHPLFLTELLRDYPLIAPAARGGIGRIVADRLARCSPGAQTLARIAASCGPTFDLDLLQHIAGWDDGPSIDRLAELLDRQFMRATALHEGGSYAFSHALVRAAVAHGTDTREQIRIHRIAARALEARAAPEKYDVEIAGHWISAGEPQRAAEAYARAARVSLGVHARDEAASLATRGLAIATDARTKHELLGLRIAANLRRVPPAQLRCDAALLAQFAAGFDDDARYDAALLRLRIEETGGDLEARAAAAAVLRASIPPDRTTPLRAAQIAEADAKNALAGGDFRGALVHAAVALEQYAAAGRPAGELRVAIFTSGVHGRLGRVAEALSALLEIEPRIDAIDDLALAMEYWYARTTVPHAQRNPAATLHAADRLRMLAQIAGDRLMEGHAAVMSAAAHQHASALSRTIVELDCADAIYRSIGADAARQTARNNRASVLFQIGRLDEAERLLRELYAQGQRDGGAEARYFAASNLGCVLLALGETDAALQFQVEALDLARSMGSDGFAALALGDLGAAELAAGRRAAGLAHLLEAAGINRRLGRQAVLAHDLARAAGGESTDERGTVHARGALAVVESGPDDIALAPEILNRCSQVFERAGDLTSAAYCRRRGRDLLERRLVSIEGSDRAVYAALRWHRALLAPLGEVDPILR